MMIRLAPTRHVFIVIHLLIVVHLMTINCHVLSPSSYSRNGYGYGNGNDTRQPPSYTIAILKGEREPPTHTIAIVKPFLDETNPATPHQYALIYKPFLQPDQFTLVDQYESHEGEVFENEVSQQPQADPAANNEYYASEQLFGNLSGTDSNSYFPIRGEQTASGSGGWNFTGYPAALPAAIASFTGFRYPQPNAEYAETGYPAMPLASESPQLELPLLQLEPEPHKGTSITTTEHNEYALHYYLGYKFWYSILLFAVYHTIVFGVLHLHKLARHYSSQLAAATLHTAALASDR